MAMHPMLEYSGRVREKIAQGFGDGRVLVVGDLMLDRYLWGDVERISPEAPVPVVRLERESDAAGGAANVALNLVGLGLDTALVGVVGEDTAGARVRNLVRSGGIAPDGLITAADRPTTIKDRVMGGRQQMLRIDREATHDLSPDAEARLLETALGLVSAGVSVVVLSDYAKGALTPAVCQALISEARRVGVPIIVDPKGLDYTKYRGATALSPNRSELAAACHVPRSDLPVLLEAGRRIRGELDLEFLVVTLGPDGMQLIRKDEAVYIPALTREVFDVSGAGDTVIATLAAGLSARLSADESLKVAALAASVVIGRVGTAPIARGDVSAALDRQDAVSPRSGVYRLPDLQAIVQEWREAGARIVFTNGCFDLLHAGHITVLDSARAEGDRLVVGLNSDASTRRLKGEPRPIVPQQARARVLAALTAVDAVVIFDQDTPLDLVQAIRPDVIVKGNDYPEEEVIGAAEVKSWGGRVVLVPLEEGHSTSELLRRFGSR